MFITTSRLFQYKLPRPLALMPWRRLIFAHAFICIQYLCEIKYLVSLKSLPSVVCGRVPDGNYILSQSLCNVLDCGQLEAPPIVYGIKWNEHVQSSTIIFFSRWQYPKEATFQTKNTVNYLELLEMPVVAIGMRAGRCNSAQCPPVLSDPGVTGP